MCLARGLVLVEIPSLCACGSQSGVCASLCDVGGELASRPRRRRGCGAASVSGHIVLFL